MRLQRTRHSKQCVEQPHSQELEERLLNRGQQSSPDAQVDCMGRDLYSNQCDSERRWTTCCPKGEMALERQKERKKASKKKCADEYLASAWTDVEPIEQHVQVFHLFEAAEQQESCVPNTAQCESCTQCTTNLEVLI